MAGGFQGWTGDFQRFFLGLELDNSKRYFEANRKFYLEHIRAPMERLLEVLEPEFGPGRIFRVNRDIRFAADKSPYKTNIAASVRGGGYLALDAKGLTVASGHYHLERPELDAYRRAVAAGPSRSDLQGIVGRLHDTGYEVGGEDLKRAPAGFPSDHARLGLLRHKRLYFWRAFGLEPWLGTPLAQERVRAVWLDGRPLEEWFARHVPPAV